MFDIIDPMSLRLRSSRCLSVLACLLASCGGAGAPGATTQTAQSPEIRFTLRPSPASLAELSVEACYDAIPFSTTPALAHIRDVERSDGGDPLLVSPEGSVDLRPLDSGDCIRYVADLPADGQLSFGGAEAGYWMGPPSLLLVIPHTAPRDTPVAITWEGPSDDVATFSSLRREGEQWRANVAAIRSAALVGWGRGFGQDGASAGGGALEWTLLPGSEWPVETVSAWLGDALRGASSVLGRFPYETFSMVVVPVDEPPSPVVFDYLVPGTGGVALVRVDRSLGAGELREHGAALLEMLRLGMPVMTDDLWLTEGILAYYREIVGARLGYQSKNDAFRHLHVMLGSFQARRDRPSDSDMSELLPSERGAEKGVAFALIADVAFRARGTSLDERLSAAFGEASARNAIHSADAVIAALDAGLEEPVAGPAARAIRSGAASAELDAAYQRLALTPKRRGRLSLRGRSDGSALRTAITSAPPPAAEEAVAAAESP